MRRGVVRKLNLKIISILNWFPKGAEEKGAMPVGFSSVKERARVGFVYNLNFPRCHQFLCFWWQRSLI